jgi:hypothetical protein
MSSTPSRWNFPSRRNGVRGQVSQECLGLITKMQYVGMESMICGSDFCSSEYYLNDEGIEYRKPH